MAVMFWVTAEVSTDGAPLVTLVVAIDKATTFAELKAYY